MYRLSHYINIIYNTFVMHDNVSELSKNQTEESSWDGQQEYYWAGGGGGGLQLVCGRPNLGLISVLIPQTLSCSVCVEDSWLISALS